VPALKDGRGGAVRHAGTRSAAGAASGCPHPKRDTRSELLHALETLSGTVCDPKRSHEDPPWCYHWSTGSGSAVGCSAPGPSCLFLKDLMLSRPSP